MDKYGDPLPTSTLRGGVEGSRPRWPPPPLDHQCPRTKAGLLVEVVERCRLNHELVAACASASNCWCTSQIHGGNGRGDPG